MKISRKQFRQTPYFKPYEGSKYALKCTGRGVYIIREGKQIVYVGFASKDIRNTIYRHFQQWIDKRSNFSKKSQRYERVTYAGKNLNNFSVKIYFCEGLDEAMCLEEILIGKLRPRDNTQKIATFDANEYYKIKNKISDAIKIEPDTEQDDLPFTDF